MCTYTLIKLQSGDSYIRIIFNRDEQHSRSAATPPKVNDLEHNRKAIMPTDSDSGGTWIAVNDAGMSMALLNVNAETYSAQHSYSSRGLIIPRLLNETSSRRAIDTAKSFNLTQFRPFRLVCADLWELCFLRWDGRNLHHEYNSIEKSPFLFTSSGLGDFLAEKYRQEIFEKMLKNKPKQEIAEAQQAFHSSFSAEHSEVSVFMNREGACTVSKTIIDVSNSTVKMIYQSTYPENRHFEEELLHRYP